MNKLPEGLQLSDLVSSYDEAYSIYQPLFKRMRLLDATDKGKLWKAINAVLPAYQLLPDTNHVAKTKLNIISNLYAVGRSAEFQPRTEDEVNLAIQWGNVLDHIWDKENVPYVQMQTGSYAAIHNLGVTHVSYNAETKRPVYTALNPMRYMRDPYVKDVRDAQYTITWDWYHESALANDPLYKDEWKKLKGRYKGMASNTTAETERLSDTAKSKSLKHHKVLIFTYWFNSKMYEVHTLDNQEVLHVKEVKPARIPYAELYCNLPDDDVVGISPASLIFASSVVYNIMTSMMATAEYKNQRPPRFIDRNAGIDLRSFIQHGNDADYTFLADRIKDVVNYHNFPQVSQVAPMLLNILSKDMGDVSGVTDKYMGKDTGSILTTGGIQDMLDQVTMIDQPKIVNYQIYTKQLTALTLDVMREFGIKTTYYFKDSKGKFQQAEVDFTDLPDDVHEHLSMNISPHLPKTRARNAQTANMMMEKQMQYASTGQRTQLISPEEWLELQDLPQKERMMERMKQERSTDFLEVSSRIITTYATLTGKGVAPEEALIQTASMISETPTGMPPL